MCQRRCPATCVGTCSAVTMPRAGRMHASCQVGSTKAFPSMSPAPTESVDERGRVRWRLRRNRTSGTRSSSVPRSMNRSTSRVPSTSGLPPSSVGPPTAPVASFRRASGWSPRMPCRKTNRWVPSDSAWKGASAVKRAVVASRAFSAPVSTPAGVGSASGPAMAKPTVSISPAMGSGRGAVQASRSSPRLAASGSSARYRRTRCGSR